MRRTSRRPMVVLIAACGAMVSAFGACVPTLPPLQGITPVNGALPTIALHSQPRQVVFTWELEANTIVARGNGAARLIAPDSARVDLFLAGGLGGGASAILLGDSLILPSGGDGFKHMIPPSPILWATLGRLAIPPCRTRSFAPRVILYEGMSGTPPSGV